LYPSGEHHGARVSGCGGLFGRLPQVPWQEFGQAVGRLRRGGKNRRKLLLDDGWDFSTPSVLIQIRPSSKNRVKAGQRKHVVHRPAGVVVPGQARPLGTHQSRP
jgi:hypothetical protein